MTEGTIDILYRTCRDVYRYYRNSFYGTINFLLGLYSAKIKIFDAEKFSQLFGKYLPHKILDIKD
jgi:hypothetical protein